MAHKPSTKLVLTGLLLALTLVSNGALGKEPAPSEPSATVSLEELPRQGIETYRRILQGGPFPYEKDGAVFGNRERRLPVQKRGYYREYTVATPGVKNRGTRRIVCGGPPTRPETCYYTADHYETFRRIVP